MAITQSNSISSPYVTSSVTKHSWESIPASKSSRVFTCTRTRTGQALRNWRKVINDGGNATTPLTGVFDTIETSGGGADCVVIKAKRSSGETIDTRISGDVAVTNANHSIGYREVSTTSDFADNLARARFYKRLGDHQTQFTGMTFLGELRETVHMLHHPAAAIYRGSHSFLDALKKRKRLSARDLTVAASDLWLEYAFGWVPLLMDCKSAIDAYNRKLGHTVPSVSITGGGQKAYDTRSSVPVGWQEGDIYVPLVTGSEGLKVINRGVKSIDTHTVRYKGAVRTQVEAPPITWGDSLGFNIEQVVPTAWELLPWSFLVDYFTNVGDILSSAAVATQNLAWVNKTTITEQMYCCNTVPYPIANLDGFWKYTVSGQGQYVALKRRRVVRVANSGISLPSFQLDFDLSDRQLGNIAALLGSSLGLKRNGFDISSLFSKATALHPQRYNR